MSPTIERPAEQPSARAAWQEPGAPVVVFDRVQLAFDDKVVLKSISFTLIKGHTKIILGASGSGKSTILKIITGLLRADGGVVWVNGERVDQLTERQLMAVRANLGMIFQEGALFDSLTVRENVGYKLYEESDMPLHEVRRRRDLLGGDALARLLALLARVGELGDDGGDVVGVGLVRRVERGHERHEVVVDRVRAQRVAEEPPQLVHTAVDYGERRHSHKALPRTDVRAAPNHLAADGEVVVEARRPPHAQPLHHREAGAVNDREALVGVVQTDAPGALEIRRSDRLDPRGSRPWSVPEPLDHDHAQASLQEQPGLDQDFIGGDEWLTGADDGGRALVLTIASVGSSVESGAIYEERHRRG